MAERTLVVKFGGTSVGSPQALQGMAEIVRDIHKEWPRLAVVVSAMGGVTDLVLAGAAAACRGDSDQMIQSVKAISEKHLQAIREGALGEETEQAIAGFIEELEHLYHAVTVLREASPRALDAIASLGERMSIQVVAGYLRRAGVSSIPLEATSFLLTDSKFQNASPIMLEIPERARPVFDPMFQRGEVPVVP